MSHKIDWKKRVAESGGTVIFLPEAFKKTAVNVEELRAVYNKEAEKMAEREITLQIRTQEMFYELRRHLAANGMTDIWLKDLGLDANALKDGQFVLNLLERNQ